MIVAETRPSKDSNKKGVLIISTIQINARKKDLKVFEILPDANDQVVGVEEFLPEAK